MTIGSRLVLLSAVFILLAPLTAGGQKKPKNDTPADYSVIAGTVFREPGFALPEAEVVLSAAPAADDTGKTKARKTGSFRTNGRGEFAFRVPSAEARYVVAASAKGYAKQQKTVEIHPGERVDVTFTLAPESNK